MEEIDEKRKFQKRYEGWSSHRSWIFCGILYLWHDGCCRRLAYLAVIRQTLETYSFLPLVDVEKLLKESQVPFTGLQHENVSLEDAFIGLTGKY